MASVYRPHAALIGGSLVGRCLSQPSTIVKSVPVLTMNQQLFNAPWHFRHHLIMIMLHTNETSPLFGDVLTMKNLMLAACQTWSIIVVVTNWMMQQPQPVTSLLDTSCRDWFVQLHHMDVVSCQHVSAYCNTMLVSSRHTVLIVIFSCHVPEILKYFSVNSLIIIFLVIILFIHLLWVQPNFTLTCFEQSMCCAPHTDVVNNNGLFNQTEWSVISTAQG